MAALWHTWARRRAAFGLAALAGGLYCLGFCGWGQAPLAWICLVPLLWAWQDPQLSTRGAAMLAWTTGLTAHLGAFPWIVHLLRVFAYLPLPLALLGYLLLCLGQSSLFAGAGALAHLLWRRAAVPLALALPVAWVLAEWTWPALFPSYLANSQIYVGAVAQTLDLTGPLGLSALVAAGNCVAFGLLASLVRPGVRPPWRATAACAALLAAAAAYGYARTADLEDTLAHAPRRVRVGLAQANLGIYEKGESPRDGVRRHRDQSLELERQGAELVVWPESAVLFPLFDHTADVRDEILGPLKTPVLFGGLRVSRGPRGRQLYNSAFLAAADGTLLGHYDKTHLLMFGEYLPLGEAFPALYELVPAAAHLTPGPDSAPLLLDGVHYGVLICYEDILPPLARATVNAGAEVLVNLTNDAWYGDGQEPRIHLALATSRAIEQRRYLVRATNSGISAIVDPLGRTGARTGTFVRANLVGEVVPLTERTLYARLGDWPGWVALGVVAGYGARAAWRRRRRDPRAPGDVVAAPVTGATSPAPRPPSHSKQ